MPCPHAAIAGRAVLAIALGGLLAGHATAQDSRPLPPLAGHVFQSADSQAREAELHRKDEELRRLRIELDGNEGEFARVVAEREEFRRRVIAHETKSTEETGKSVRRSRSSELVSPTMCEACGRREVFCICAR